MSATTATTARAGTVDDAIAAHLEEAPTIGLRDLGRAVGVSRTSAHKAVRRLEAAGRLTVVRLGTCAEEPSTYALTEA